MSKKKIHKGTTNVYLLPNGNVVYDMGIWYRELGPCGKDWGNSIAPLPEGAIQLVKVGKQ